MEFSVMVRDKTKSELKADLQATKQADSGGYKRTFGDLKATTLSKARMGERLAASGVSTKKVARNGTRPAITFMANPHYGELESSSVAKAAEAIGDTYVGQAVGHLVLTVMNAPHNRRNLTESQVKSIFKRQKGKCA
eukprot:1677229-Prymnesium_polylepis.1